MKHALSVRIGPVGFRIGSDWRAPIEQLTDLYRDYPTAPIADYTVRLFASRAWRRWVRPSVTIGGDYMLPEAAPLPLSQGLLAAEMAMNLQLALGHRRHLLLHASVVERDGRALLMTGESGAGKSTLATLLAAHGWRFMGDEFALLDGETGQIHAFPRLISLKGTSVAAATSAWPDGRFGPLLAGTPKGDIRHLVPPVDAIARMDEPAIPALLLFPRHGFAADTREVPASEAFVRLTQASTNYVALGEAGFAALTGLVRAIPARAIDYPDGATAIRQVEELWART
ncbi:HprK-related kinase A [Sphingomonas oligophenolica]|uniref:HprK-related kinase A n=1 Tax=Sphingomonas oligophenolica TaxID=301154 RepID=A0A502CK67_9SPHN|nr:HprK-related kinase A [Sphingomonas oligophenolica]TPG12091.1 HprK-related kinase A [Sphingomonas oligophenolica]